MANPFDRFDAPAPSANPFDRFDAKPAGGGTWPYIDNLVRQTAQGATMGFADEATAYLDSLQRKVGPRDSMAGAPIPGPGPGPTYDEALTAGRTQDKAFSDANPIASTAANVGGALMTIPLLPAFAAPKAASFLSRMGRNVATGMGYGTVAGFGSGEGGLEGRALPAAIGGTAGGIAGAILPPAISGAQWLGRTFNESAPGRWLGANVAAPVYDKAAGAVEAMAPKASPGSLSAAAPDGGQALPVEGVMSRVADMLRARADAGRGAATRGAQERLAGEFERQGLDPQAIARELQGVGEGGVLANAGGTATQRIARTAYDAPGPAAGIIDTALTAQRLGAPRRVQGAFEGDTPPPTAYDAKQYLEMNKGRVGAEMYPPAWEAGQGWTGGMGPQTEAIKRLRQVPAINEAFQQIEAQAAHNGETLTPLQVAHRVKQAITDRADAAYRNEGVSKFGSGQLADDWRGALHDANPKLADADAAFAQAAKLPDLLEQGRQFLRAGTSEAATEVSPSALAANLPKLDDAGRLAFRVGSTNTARDIAMQGPGPARRLAGNISENEILQEKLAQIYGPERAAEIIRTGGAERSMMRTDQAIRGGPNTASKLAHLVDDGLQMPGIPSSVPSGSGVVMSGLRAAADWAKRQQAGNEPVRTEIARMLMEANPTANLKTLDTIEALMRQRMAAQLLAARGSGAAGATAGQLGILGGP